MNAHIDRSGMRFRIRNSITGAYIHVTLFKLLEFDTRAEALWYMRRNGLSPEIYYVEEIR
jgi:hypothetical protein